ncbi:kinesin-like protein KIF19 isoform X3 [Denticeps clupeoides]|uniref:kinesin-like protein KIF19 isoform X3 n=1 Tax=Denticeps clupeoides TaxID=299321 RepID=UPI0010A3724C|nr:kinesin-like protein KIF19 isoform X3 [Denticeps clupeoides]
MKELPGGSKDHQLTVALRIRPMNEAELEEGATVVAKRVDDQMVVLMDPCEDSENHLRANRSREKTYMFDVAFDQKAQQEEVYEATTKNLIEGVISGYNATVFAYGPTGAGKTYTMLGVDSEPGIYVRTLNDLFKAIEASRDDMDCCVFMSYLEIYNEVIRDLLNPSSGYLDLREDAKGEIRIAGITEFSTSNAKEIMALLTKGNKQRTQEPTAANKTSSRSHAILQVTVKQKNRIKDVSEEVRMGKLFMVDLAGTERASQTQNRGKRMKEGAHINRSLLALANCINALSEKAGKGSQFVNYRDSKLTRLLKDALGGNSRTVMIAHISPASTNFEESRNTLLYADKAKNIRTKVKRNLLNVNYHLAQYTSIIADLRKEIDRLRTKIEQQSQGEMDNISQEGQQYSRKEVCVLRDQLLSAFREQMEVRRSLMELENSNMELHIDTSRHLVTITDWEREQTRHVRCREHERGGKRDTGEDGDDSGGEELAEPQDVTAAREEIVSLLAEQRSTMAMKCELEGKLKTMKLKSSQMEELLPQRISDTEQREILTLLCRLHELEVENTEVRTLALCKENALRSKDFIIQRHEQQRTLYDDIIQQQKTIIEEQGLTVPQELQLLYSRYFNELSEGNLDQILNLHTITTSCMRDGSILTVARQLKLDDLVSELIESSQADLSPRSGNRTFNISTSRGRALPSSFGPDNDSDSNRACKSTIKHRQQTRRPLSISPQSGMQPMGSKAAAAAAMSADTLKEIASDTKSISVIAAQRRTRMQAANTDKIHLPNSTLERGVRVLKSSSVRSSSGELQHTNSAAKTMPRPTAPVTMKRRLKPAASMESLVVSTPEEGGIKANRPAGSSPSVRRRGLPGTECSANSPGTRTRKKRSRSFEINKLKPRAVLESASDNRLVCLPQGNIQTLLNSRGNPATPPVAKFKYPLAHHTAENQLQKLEIRGTQPSTIHQKNVEGRRGQILNKHGRGQLEASGPCYLLRQPGNHKKTANGTVQQKVLSNGNSKKNERHIKKVA